MKLPNKLGKNPSPSHQKRIILKPHTAAWLLVLTVFTGAVAYAAGGVITLNGATSGTVTVQVPAVAGATTFQLPGTNGTSGFVLSTDGTGVTSWISNAGTASTALSGITAATATNTINSTNKAQTWNWNSLSTQTALTIGSSSMTTGTLLSLQDTAASATSTGKVLSISDATTGSGYGVYSSMSGHGNTGYAGYFTNTDTGADVNYGVYGITLSTGSQSAGVFGECDNSNCQGIVGISNGGAGVYSSGGVYGVYATTASTGTGYGVYGTISGANNTGYAGYFYNADTSSATNYGVFATISSTSSNSVGVYGSDQATTGNGAGVEGNTNSTASGAIGVYGHNATAAAAGSGVYGYMSGAGNTGYAGYFQNTATTANYGVYATTASTGAGYGVYASITGAANTGYAGYFNNTATTGYSLYAPGAAPSYFAGYVGVGINPSSTRPLSVSQSVSRETHISIDNSAGTSRVDAIDFDVNGSQMWEVTNDWFDTFTQTFAIYDTVASTVRFFIDPSGNVGIGTTSPNTNLDVGPGFIEWGGESRVSATFTKTSDTTLAAITGLSSTLVAGKTYAFEIQLFTTGVATGGTKVDLNGGTATATSIIGQATSLDGTTVRTGTRIAALRRRPKMNESPEVFQAGIGEREIPARPSGA